MEQTEKVISVLGGIVAAVGVMVSIVLGVIAYRRANRHDIAYNASVETALKVDIDYIKRGIDDIMGEQCRMREDFGHLSERVTRVEESVKSAHKRLDQLISLRAPENDA